MNIVFDNANLKEMKNIQSKFGNRKKDLCETVLVDQYLHCYCILAH